MKTYFKNLTPIFLTLILSSFSLSANENIPSLKEMAEVSGLNLNFKDIDAGKIITLSREDQERVDTSIALSMGLYLKAPFGDVVNALQEGDNTISEYEDAKLVHIKNMQDIKPYFEGVNFTQRESEEVDKLFDYKKGDAFNLSKDEIKRWKSIVKKNQNRNDAAASFFKEVLENRTQAYLDGGLKDISAYEHSNKDATVSEGLRSSSLHMNVFKKWFPELYNDYLHYPEVTSQKYKQKFYWLKDKIEGRTAFILKHQMVKEKENILVIAERQFYISNGLDAIQTQIICVPYEDGTFVALSTQSFTQKVSGFGRFVAVKVGRNQMAKLIHPIFVTLQEKFNH